jgi:hypothetical protein
MIVRCEAFNDLHKGKYSLWRLFLDQLEKFRIFVNGLGKTLRRIILNNKHMKQGIFSEKFRVGRLCFFLLVWLAGMMEVKAQPNLVFNVLIPEIALVDVEPEGNNNISLDLTPPSEAGLGASGTTAANNSLWLNYTSSKSAGGPARSVYVQAIGDIPSGVQIKLQASARSGAGGAGLFGTPVGSPVILNNSPQMLISGIGGCYTGNGIGFGHQLQFSIEISDYSFLDIPGNSVIHISYTIADY